MVAVLDMRLKRRKKQNGDERVGACLIYFTFSRSRRDSAIVVADLGRALLNHTNPETCGLRWVDQVDEPEH